MESESKGNCVAMVIAIIGFLANVVNLISLAQFIMSLRSGNIGTGPVTTFYLPFPLEQDDYALITGALLFYGTIATGVFLWFFSANQIYSSQFSKLRSWMAPQLLVVIFFTIIYWLAFKSLIQEFLYLPNSTVILLIGFFLLIFPSLISYYLYEGWSHPRRKLS